MKTDDTLRTKFFTAIGKQQESIQEINKLYKYYLVLINARTTKLKSDLKSKSAMDENFLKKLQKLNMCEILRLRAEIGIEYSASNVMSIDATKIRHLEIKLGLLRRFQVLLTNSESKGLGLLASRIREAIRVIDINPEVQVTHDFRLVYS